MFRYDWTHQQLHTVHNKSAGNVEYLKQTEALTDFTECNGTEPEQSPGSLAPVDNHRHTPLYTSLKYGDMVVGHD